MRLKVCPLSFRWSLLLLIVLSLFLLQASVKFTLYAKEETITSEQFVGPLPNDGKLFSAVIVNPYDTNSSELINHDKSNNWQSLSSSKRDLLISHEFNLNGKLGAIKRPSHAPSNTSLPSGSSYANGNKVSSPLNQQVSHVPKNARNRSDTIKKPALINSSVNSSVSHKSAFSSSSSFVMGHNITTTIIAPSPSSPLSPPQNVKTNVPTTGSSTFMKNVSSKFSSANHTSLNHSEALVAGSGMKPICPQVPPNLVGLVVIDKMQKSMDEIEKEHGANVSSGGFSAPQSCLARHRVAIIIPFRDRQEHLHIFLNHMVPFLKKQQLEFAIYIVELAPKEKFNRAMLMNIGFKEALKDKDWQCFIFHDVDLIPESDKNIYSCPASPRHMSAAVDSLGYKLPYQGIFGGVSAFLKKHYQLINGFSNLFFGWGGEDDDLFYRTKKKGLTLTRYPMNIARYTMLRHTKDKPNPERFQYLNNGVKRMSEDGINKLKYKLLATERHKLFTKIRVSIDEKEVKKGFQVKKRLRKRS